MIQAIRFVSMTKQLFCRHSWIKVSDKLMEKDGHYILMRTKCQCAKCGKVGYF